MCAGFSSAGAYLCTNYINSSDKHEIRCVSVFRGHGTREKDTKATPTVRHWHAKGYFKAADLLNTIR